MRETPSAPNWFRSFAPSISSSAPPLSAASAAGSRATPFATISPPTPSSSTAIVCDVYRARRSDCRTIGYEPGGAGSTSAGLIVCGKPSVMLSPNATKRVTDRRGGPVTVTVNVQAAVCCRASTARQVIEVDPIGNEAPLDGEHVIVKGAVPPVAVGDEKETAIG